MKRHAVVQLPLSSSKPNRQTPSAERQRRNTVLRRAACSGRRRHSTGAAAAAAAHRPSALGERTLHVRFLYRPPHGHPFPWEPHGTVFRSIQIRSFEHQPDIHPPSMAAEENSPARTRPRMRTVQAGMCRRAGPKVALHRAARGGQQAGMHAPAHVEGAECRGEEEATLVGGILWIGQVGSASEAGSGDDPLQGTARERVSAGASRHAGLWGTAAMAGLTAVGLCHGPSGAARIGAPRRELEVRVGSECLRAGRRPPWRAKDARLSHA